VTDDRPLLLLLHDRGGSPADWREFVPLFEQRFRVVAPQLPSGDEVAHARRALDGDRAGAVGHGVGGSVAQTLAAAGLVDAIVLLDSPRAEDVPDEALAALEIPALLLWGEDDDVVPVAVGEELNDAIPTSTLGVVPGCGHDLLAEAAPTIAPMILEYLRARYLRAPHAHADEGIVRIQLERRPPWVDLEEDERDDWFDVEEDART
jgi:pimeloyl-ACP methyl ester carboxylesterase